VSDLLGQRHEGTGGVRAGLVRHAQHVSARRELAAGHRVVEPTLPTLECGTHLQQPQAQYFGLFGVRRVHEFEDLAHHRQRRRDHSPRPSLLTAAFQFQTDLQAFDHDRLGHSIEVVNRFEFEESLQRGLGVGHVAVGLTGGEIGQQVVNLVRPDLGPEDRI
jgi:hypothetical protein